MSSFPPPVTLSDYGITVQADGWATDPRVTFTTTLPDGRVVKYERIDESSVYRAINSPFSIGRTYYVFEGNEFESFEKLMEDGLGLKKF